MDDRGSVLSKDAAEPDKKERLIFGGMAHWDGLDLFGPNYMSVAYRRKGEIHVRVEPSNIWKPTNPTVQRISRLPIVRSVFFWGRLLLQVVGSLWVFLFFAATLAGLWLFVRLMEFGSGAGVLGGVFAFFAEFPILPVLLLFFAAMKFTPIGRYHGAEHKAVAASTPAAARTSWATSCWPPCSARSSTGGATPSCSSSSSPRPGASSARRDFPSPSATSSRGTSPPRNPAAPSWRSRSSP